MNEHNGIMTDQNRTFNSLNLPTQISDMQQYQYSKIIKHDLTSQHRHLRCYMSPSLSFSSKHRDLTSYHRDPMHYH